ncbi:hypothetical protein ZIOFF_036647 [Zingiber officinale]|uniref:Uncharacterized protein n=1 Tax=Zingiber officinale TaxID=94328 RepID=A0A8J5GDY9_ZINOF|nr:hypothetical protein ZIOFF_036647 [Zingiber officinale]
MGHISSGPYLASRGWWDPWNPTSLLPRSWLHPPPPCRSAVTLKSPRGFGPSSRKSGKNSKSDKRPGFDEDDDDDEEDEDEIEDEDDSGRIILEVVMRRMGVSIGIPLFVGLLLFPFFYYLKAVAKLDVPTWVT